MVTVVGVVAGVALSPPEIAGARTAVIRGDLKCSVGTAQMTFDPAVVLSHHGDHRTRSRNTFTALATGCRGTTATTPAPGGIAWGVLDLKGRLWQNTCLNLTGPGAAGYAMQGPQKLTVTWYNANGEPVGRTRYRASERGLTLIFDEFFNLPLSPIATVPLTSTVRSAAKAFGSEPISTRVPIDLTDFGLRCAAGPVAAIPLLGGEISIGNPT